MRLTAFGKAVRGLRNEAGVRLFHMATALGVSSAYLSAVETGKKKVNDDLVERAIKYFHSLGVDAHGLHRAAQSSATVQTFDVKNYDDDSKELMAAFARRFSGRSELSEDAKEQLRRLLDMTTGEE